MAKGNRLIALILIAVFTLSLCFPMALNADTESAEILQQDVLYEDDFTTDANYIVALGSTSWQTFKRPTWEDGKLISGNYTAATDAKFALLNGLGADDWTDYTVEADITAGTANDRNCYVAIYGRTTDDKQAGSAYQFSYQGKSGKFLLRSNATTASGNKADLVTNVAISDYFSNYTKGDTIRMSITAITYDDYVNLICKATYNGVTKEVINYKDDREGRYTCGLPGFGLQQQNSSLDNVKVVKTSNDDTSNEVLPGTVLYEDDFTTDANYIAALGNTGWQSYKRPIWEDGKLISGNYTSAADAKFALLNGLGADDWTDYTVEADITAGTANDRNCYVAIYGRTTDDKQAGSAYQFSYQGKSGKFLLRSNATTASGNKADLVTNVAISDYFSDYTKGDAIRMSITAITYDDYVNLICKATYNGVTKEVINYKDDREGRYTGGLPGFGLQQQNSSLDNVSVVKADKNTSDLPTEILPGTVIYEDQFTTNTKYKSALGDTSWQSYKRPIWEDGKLISGNYTAAADAKFALLNGLGADSLTNYKVEADITAGTANDRICYVATYGIITDDKQAGSAYQFGYQGKSGKFLLRRNASSASGNKADLVTNVAISDYFSNYTKGDTIRMSITAVTLSDYVYLLCEVTYKGATKEIITYNDDSENRFTCGLPGFGLQQQNSSLDNIKVVKVDESIADVETEILPGTVIYEDDYATDTKYKEALGSTGWQGYKRPIWEDGKLISGDYTSAADAKFALLNGLGADSLTNYKVEADITAGTANDRICYVAAYGIITDDKQAGSAYQFGYQGKSGKFLLRRNASTASGNKEDLETGVLITDYFSNYTKGDTIRMSITAVTLNDYVYLLCEVTYKGETKKVISYKDDSDNRFTCGLPGFGLQQQNSSLDNVKVVKVDESVAIIPPEPVYAPGTVLYEDDYATDTKYKAALGGTGWQTYKRPIWSSGKLISGDYTEAKDAKFALLNGLSANNWTDYKIEADITAGTANDRFCYVAAYGRTTGDKISGDSYQFGYQGKSGYFLLRRNATGASGNKADLQKVAIATFFSDYKKGDTIHMVMTAVTFDNFVALICEATYKGNTYVIFAYSDTSKGRYTCGLPGFGLQQQNSSLDNVKVIKVDRNNVEIPSVGGSFGKGILYEDDFKTPTRYVWALGNTAWQTFNQPIWKNGKLISGDYTESSEAKYALLNGLGGDQWTDYRVEADITAGTANDRLCFVAAYGRTTGDKNSGDSYQFGYQGKSGYFLLRRNATGVSGNKADLQKVAIASYFSNYKKGDTIRMSITAVTFNNFVTLICEATYKGKTQVVFAYNDTSGGRYTCGLPGFGLQQQNSSLDNVKVVVVDRNKIEVPNMEIKYGKGVLYEDDFTTPRKYVWALGSTGWQTFNQPICTGGKLISGAYTEANEAKFALLNGLGAENWTNYTVEADITAGTANDRICYVAAYGRTTGSTVFGDAYLFGFQGSSANFVLRKTATTESRNAAIMKVLPCSYFFDNFTKGDTIRLSITAVTDATGVTLICKATYKGKTEVIFNYRDVSNDRYTCGLPGFGLQQQNSSLDNVKVYHGNNDTNQKPFYDNMPLVELTGTYTAPDTGLTTTTYSDDFEDEKVGTDPSHWIEEPTSNAWKVYKKSGKLVYGTESRGLTYTWLHTFESDPVVSMDFMVNSVGAKARLEFLTRYTQADEHGKAAIGYDVSAQKWYIYSCQGEDFLPRRVYSKSTYKLVSGQWYNVKIYENENKVWVYINDELVIADAGVEMTGYGRIGVLSQHMSLYIDNVNYSMPHSGAVNDGIMEEVWDDAVYSNFNTMEILPLGGDTLIAYRARNRYISYDRGLTWSLNLTDSYTELKAGDNASYASALKLGNGKFLMVYADTYAVMRSDDNMLTWRKVGQVSKELAELNSEEHGAIKVSKSAVIHSHSLKKFTLKDGTVRIFLPIAIQEDTQFAKSNGMYTRIFYSDDYGVTWNESTNDTRDVTPGYEFNSETEVFVWNEAKMWQCSDGTLCLSNTRDYYGLTYTESHDGGVTWEGLKSLPYIQNAVSSHDVVEDPNNPGTYYMVCLQDKSEKDGWTCPRERLILAKTTDGRNWEYVMDLERYTNYEFEGYWLNGTDRDVFQMLDPAINIIDGYMYINFGRSYKQLVNADHNYQQMRLVRIEMDKLPETKGWDASNVADPTRAAKLEIDKEAQTIFGLGDPFRLGGTIKETDFNGNVKSTQMALFSLASEMPNMGKLGTYTITLMNRYATSVSYDIEIRKNYNVEWKISGRGSVEPKNEKMIEGVSYEYTVKPKLGWQLKQVLVNGKEVKVTDNKFSITTSEDVIIEVAFKNVLIIPITLACVLFVVCGTGVGVFIFKKKRKKIITPDMGNEQITTH